MPSLPEHPATKKSKLHRKLASKDQELTGHRAEASQLKAELQRMQEVHAEYKIRTTLDFYAELDELERSHFYCIGRLELEHKRDHASKIESKRVLNAARILTLEQEVERGQRGTSELQCLLQQLLDKQMTLQQLNDAVRQLEALLCAEQ
ncbi:hypothetical protein V5O48_006297 [Marasmius crinis-equi]|uniref:Uncharacterized protein n=1 Tax=Marasmius crinis-equi TaxID=585013 RepID=A0ABR3FK90_9AGAR